MLTTAIDYLKSHGINAYAAAEYSDGVLRVQRLQPSNRLNNVYSVSKTVTATAVGMLVHRKALSDADRAITWLRPFLPQKYDPAWEEITVGNLLSHTWGQERGDLFETDRFEHGTDDWLTYVLSQPLPLARGTDMRYSNASYYLLSVIIERIVGVTLDEFIRTELALPMRWKGFAAGRCPKGHTLGATEMFLDVEDMAKLGALWLGKGVFAGTRYFGENWADLASRPLTNDGHRCYGYSIWRNTPDSDVFYGDGAYGQLVAILPDARRTVAVQCYDTYSVAGLVDALSAKAKSMRCDRE